MRKDYNTYVQRMMELAHLGGALGLMQWDKETYMPKGAATLRAHQIAGLSGMTHKLFVDKEFGDLLDSLVDSDDLGDKERRNVELTLRDYRKEVKLSREFVEKLSRASAEAFHAWEEAKQEDDFKRFYPNLEKLVDLKLEEAEIRGYENHPYDVFLDLYEPNLTVAFLDTTFSEAKEGIQAILDRIKPEEHRQEFAFLKKEYAKDKQWDFGIEVLQGLGYDFRRGRQDLSTHPFTISFSPDDVRVTTRIDTADLSNMVWSCIHEAGHALYGQGLPVEDYGLPAGSAVSLGIHESQSRLWENHVGRSMAFWSNWLPVLKSYFPDQLKGVSLEEFYAGINQLSPNLIRTEADELHYHLHVIIRYELEKDLFEGKLKASDLRESWNAKYQDYLGIRVPSDAKGILQDVHWSHGSFGYFPTYSLGSFYAAQFYRQATEDIQGLEEQIASGDCSVLLEWLKDKIHRHGRLLDPDDLCRSVTGEVLDVNHFLEYAGAKFSRVYTDH